MPSAFISSSTNDRAPLLRTTPFPGSRCWRSVRSSPSNMASPPSPLSATTCRPGWAAWTPMACGSALDAVPDAVVGDSGHRRVQELLGVVVAQSANRELGNPRHGGLFARFPEGEHHANGFGPKSAGDELERLRRSLVQPLRIVDDTDQGPLFGDRAEQ